MSLVLDVDLPIQALPRVHGLLALLPYWSCQILFVPHDHKLVTFELLDRSPYLRV